MDDQELMEMAQETSYEEPQVTTVEAEPTYVDTTPTYQAPAPSYNYVPQQYNSYETDTDEGGLDAKSVVVGGVITAAIGGAAYGIKKLIDFGKKMKAEKEKYKKWQEDRKAAEETIAKAKATGNVVDVDAKPVEAETKTEEVKTEAEPEPEAKN